MSEPKAHQNKATGSHTIPMPKGTLTGGGYVRPPTRTMEEAAIGMLKRLNDSDNVNHPTHYARSKDVLGVEVIDILEFFFEDRPRLWQVGKYIMRAGHKSNELEDLMKARFYLDREIEKLEDTNGKTE